MTADDESLLLKDAEQSSCVFLEIKAVAAK